MADITMCLNTQCPIAGTCYRIQAPADRYQSVMHFEYRVTRSGVKCDYYWPTEQSTGDKTRQE